MLGGNRIKAAHRGTLTGSLRGDRKCGDAILRSSVVRTGPASICVGRKTPSIPGGRQDDRHIGEQSRMLAPRNASASKTT
jgi:hypothetical protein